MRAMIQRPELLDRSEVASFRSATDGAIAAWPDEAFSPWWHNKVIPTVGARVLLCFRVPTAAGWHLGWGWAVVCEVRRFRLVVEMLQPVPLTELVVMFGHRLSIDPTDHPHVTLAGPEAQAAHAEWLLKFQATGPQPPHRGDSHAIC